MGMFPPNSSITFLAIAIKCLDLLPGKEMLLIIANTSSYSPFEREAISG
jgi:hypothetical protein